MSLRRSGRDAEPAPDFLVRAPGRDQLDHLPLTLGDPRRRCLDFLGMRAKLGAGRAVDHPPNGVFGPVRRGQLLTVRSNVDVSRANVFDGVVPSRTTTVICFSCRPLACVLYRMYESMR